MGAQWGEPRWLWTTAAGHSYLAQVAQEALGSSRTLQNLTPCGLLKTWAGSVMERRDQHWLNSCLTQSMEKTDHRRGRAGSLCPMLALHSQVGRPPKPCRLL